MQRLISIILFAATAALAQYSTPVRDVENPARTPIHIVFTCATTVVSGTDCVATTPIPSGYRLVVEMITFLASSTSNTSPVRLQVDVSVDGAAHVGSHYFGPTFMAGTYCLATHNVRFYADAMSNINFVGTPAGSTPTLSMAGYLVKK